MTEPIQDYYDADVAKLNALAAKSAKRAEELKAENEKLWKLVRDMLYWMPCRQPCYSCERYHYPDGCEFETRYRKLGIEVK